MVRRPYTRQVGVELHTTEMHTAGEPVRIVTGGYPPIPGDTILAKRRHARDHLDHLRRMLMFEPRGHAGMYGVIPVAPDHPDADLAVLFCHNEGYSTMCGHATIALGRWALDTGRVAATLPETAVRLQVPAGLVSCRVAADGEVWFESVPAFALALDEKVDVPGYGPVAVDVAFGGAFYALARAADVGLDVEASPTRELVDAAAAITAATVAAVPIVHPGEPDLAFLYGTILVDDATGLDHSANVCVFAGRQVDRSPCGSGVTARIAADVARGRMDVGATREFSGPTGASFTGTAVRAAAAGPHDGVVVEVGGRAHYSGRATFTLEDDDPLPSFLLD